LKRISIGTIASYLAMLNKLFQQFWHKGNYLLEFVEILLIKGESNELFQFPPVFIIGPPRAGTTLLYQLMVNRYHFSYMNNLTRIFYGAPYLVDLVTSRWVRASIDRTYKSNYGRTKSLCGPSEVGNFWRRWFENHKFNRKKIPLLRRELIAISQKHSRSVLFKNTYNSMRIMSLAEIFPEAIFIVCSRDHVDTAQSILKARIDRFNDKKHWMGVEPKNSHEIKKHPYWQQVVEQIYYIEKQINDDARAVGKEKFYKVLYEDLCGDVHRHLDLIAAFLRNKGCRIETKYDVPRKFSISKRRKISAEDYERIAAHAREFWPLDSNIGK
jgi:hypothetical protein